MNAILDAFSASRCSWKRNLHLSSSLSHPIPCFRSPSPVIPSLLFLLLKPAEGEGREWGWEKNLVPPEPGSGPFFIPLLISCNSSTWFFQYKNPWERKQELQSSIKIQCFFLLSCSWSLIFHLYLLFQCLMEQDRNLSCQFVSFLDFLFFWFSFKLFPSLFFFWSLFQDITHKSFTVFFTSLFDWKMLWERSVKITLSDKKVKKTAETASETGWETVKERPGERKRWIRPLFQSLTDSSVASETERQGETMNLKDQRESQRRESMKGKTKSLEGKSKNSIPV